MNGGSGSVGDIEMRGEKIIADVRGERGMTMTGVGISLGAVGVFVTFVTLGLVYSLCKPHGHVLLTVMRVLIP